MYFVYILTNAHHTVFYTGITDNLIRRMEEHQSGKYNGFTKRYNVFKLVYYEQHQEAAFAAKRELLIKKWKRHYKMNVIIRNNPYLSDLFHVISKPMLEEIL